jgi:hypothetical protein
MQDSVPTSKSKSNCLLGWMEKNNYKCKVYRKIGPETDKMNTGDKKSGQNFSGDENWCFVVWSTSVLYVE